jgi:hypothetical protein
MIRWKLLLINSFLLLTTVFLSFSLIKLVNTPYDYDKLAMNTDKAGKENQADIPKIDKKSNPNLSFFGEIVDKDLFRPDRKEFVEKKGDEKKEEDVDVEQPNFLVRGITIFGESENSYRAAIIEKKPSKNTPTRPIRGSNPTAAAGDNASLPPKIYKEGDEIGTGWVVKKIYDRRVEFCHGDNCIYVSLYKTYEDSDYVPPKQPLGPGETPGPGSIPGASRGVNPTPNPEATPGTNPEASPENPPRTPQAPDFSAEEFKRLIQQGGKQKP